jgi:hypothetical protein
MSNRTKFTDKKRGEFLAALRDIPNVSRAARVVHLSRRALYNIRDDDSQFEAAWNDAIDEGIEAMEAEAMRRAVEGVDKPVFYQGDEVAVLREYSDTLLIFLLKAHRPDKYRENKIDLTTDGGPIGVTFSKVDYRESLPDNDVGDQ